MSIKEKRLDPRVKRTRQFLRTALIELIQEKGFEPIKVKEITERATLNKATFYLHYRDKEDLLIRSTYELIGELEEKIGDPARLPNGLDNEAIVELLTIYFDHFLKHADFYNVILNKIGTPPVMQAIQNPIENLASKWLAYLQSDSSEIIVEHEVIIRFISSGCIGLLQKWLDENSNISAAQMAERLSNLIILGMYQSAGFRFLNDPDKPDHGS